VTTAEKIGLLNGFGWIVGAGFLGTLLRCYALTPVGHLLVGLVLEGRFVPLLPPKQFSSFFPGDLFLGLSVALLITLAGRIPDGTHWYQSTTWHVIVLVVAFIVATLMTYGEWKSEFYPAGAIFSPTKIYHNYVLYVGYGYVAVTTLVAVVFGSNWSWRFAGTLALCLVPVLIWGSLVKRDDGMSPEKKQEAARHAHVTDWKLFGLF